MTLPPITGLSPFSEGTQLGRFRLLHKLGQGSFSVVWEAFDSKLHRSVAIKIPRNEFQADQAEKFLAEARHVASLKHQGIVELYEIVVDPEMKSMFLVLERVEGVSLSEWCSFIDATEMQIAEVIAQTAFAVHHAHQNGIVHRDLKPANILVDLAGQVHVTDFGLAANLGPTTTSPTAPVGTAAYVSPEQSRSGTISPQSDIFSMGAMIFQLLTGRLPFEGDTREAYLQSVATDRPHKCLRVNPKASKDLAAICDKCLSVNPADRYTSAKELGDDLMRFCNGFPVYAGEFQFGRNLIKFAKRNRLGTIGLATAVLMVCLLLIAFESLRSTQRESERAKRESLIRTLLTCRPNSISDILATIHNDQGQFAKYLAEQELPDEPNARFEMAMLASGIDRRESIVRTISQIPSQESAGFIAALQLFSKSKPNKSLSTITIPADANDQTKIRVAIVNCYLNDFKYLSELALPVNHASNRTNIINELRQFHGPILETAEWITKTDDPELHYVLALTLGDLAVSVQSDAERTTLIRQLRELAIQTPDSGVFSACRWACKQFNHELDFDPNTNAPAPATFTNESIFKFKGIHFVAIPTLPSTSQADSSATPIARDQSDVIFISSCEVPNRVFMEFLKATNPDVAKPMFEYPSDEPLTPVRAIDGSLIPEFCNWLSKSFRMQPCYATDGSIEFKNSKWNVDLTRNGFRLPTEEEWEFAARGFSSEEFPWGKTNENQLEYTVNRTEILTERIDLVEGKKPNRLGLFDMIGSLQEPCHSDASKIVFRGGYIYTILEDCNLKFRHPANPTSFINNPMTGIRLVTKGKPSPVQIPR